MDHDANVNLKSFTGCNALHYASYLQSKYTVDVMRILVNHGSTINEKDNQGSTLLHLAGNGNTKWTEPIVKFLLEQGAVESFNDYDVI